MLNGLPSDPIMLLSIVNTNLRDYYHSFDELCVEMEADKKWILNTLKSVDYEYDPEYNQFV
ncbi:DUF4250 domain-containing protein [Hespellia stercorisuis]|uniref:DUF4250 domain-containing protein n=1 Tax=Hespellia stercorisuis DSM 15480 TaxID=1121950 RepID=A0A1M6N4Q7_9FIRM|nr:DUF4250 domain-containing protein [Hespellia stercorisuis]SHJ90616.1 protein of unknown function [Hespellia stercorisuis DSM 15480]